jgi:phasin family protein
MANNPRQSEREASETSHAVKRAAEQATQTGRAMAEQAERTARAGTEAVRRNAETMSSHWRSGSEAANRIAERSVDQFAKVFGLSSDATKEAMQRSSGNLQALMESTTIIAGGLQNVSGEWMRFAQSRLEENLDHFDDLMGCRTMQEILGLHTEIVRENFEAMLQSLRRASELSTHVADDAIRKISEPTLAPQ